MIEVNPEWWKTLFDDVYIITDARSVCDEVLTCREVDFIEKTLKPEKSSPILDLCGGHGRHSRELSRRGFTDVTVLDYSHYLVNLGREKAQREGLRTVFVEGDARDTGLPDQSYGFIIVMASSFGYFVEQKEDEKILGEAFRMLMSGGSLLLDLPNRDYVLEHLSPESWHEADEDIVVCRQRTVEDDTVFSREVVISKNKGLLRDAGYCTRLYSPERISECLKSAGFSSVTIQKDFASHTHKADYGCMTNRMIVVAQRI
jgi:D-alanine-D-alanine ligase